MFGQKRTFSSAMDISLDESESLKRIKCESTPQKSKTNVIVDRSAISEEDDVSLAPVPLERAVSETVINPMLRSLVSRQKKAR
jgi:hypothetical protein